MSAMSLRCMFCLLGFGLLGATTALASTTSPDHNSGLNKTYIYDEPEGSLRVGFYDESCPTAELVISSWVEKAVSEDPRVAASLVRLHFHDCFVNGCDGSVLLEDTTEFRGEKTAPPNLNSLRGFELIDDIKAELELVCPRTVSCADILAIAARDAVVVSSGPRWEVAVGRKDSLFASYDTAVSHLPGPDSNFAALLSAFQDVGLTLADLVALSGAHTIGKAHCSAVSSRLQIPDDPEFLNSDLHKQCYHAPYTTLTNLDPVTPLTFDNQYYMNLVKGEGLFVSDQMLVANDVSAALVDLYAADNAVFFEDFKLSMARMGRLRKLEGGEIRVNCRFRNYVID